MMAIVSSTITEDTAQIDGRRQVTERHVDHVGAEYFWRYIAEAAADISAAMQSRVASIEALLKRIEVERTIRLILRDGYTGTPTLNWNTNTEFGLALRAYYKQATDREAVRIGWYVNSLGLTDNQLKNFFGLNDANLAAAKLKLATYSTLYENMIAAAGD